MPLTATLSKSNKPDKRYKVKVDNKTIHFGSKGGSAYIDHKNDQTKRAWIARHKVNENWAKGGVKTAGFWAKHLLWNKPPIKQSINSTNKNYNMGIKYG